MIIPTCCLLSFLLTSLKPRADDACPPGIGRVVTAGNAIFYHSFLVILFTQGDDSTLATVIYSPHSRQGNPHARAAPRLARRAHLADQAANLGALNALEAVGASGARYWIATHDEVKRGGGFIALLLDTRLRTPWRTRRGPKERRCPATMNLSSSVLGMGWRCSLLLSSIDQDVFNSVDQGQLA
ncbi:hypothetical protein B0H13DRAFT_1887470 [Mycena leptocephala]|nr:hypothetical protein B0H13DRAFT_1887470 [Mycena leptocephala]